MADFVVIGGGGHAKVVTGLLKKTGHRVLGYTDARDRGSLLGAPYLGSDAALADISARHRNVCAVVGVGKVDVNSRRLELQNEAEALGFSFPAIVSPTAVINEEVEVGDGSVVLDNAVINCGARIGRGCIVNSGSIVEHDCRIGDDVHLAPGVTLSGTVEIGNHCMIGVGATVVQSVRIVDNCLLGAGAVLVRDAVESGLYLGIPATRRS